MDAPSWLNKEFVEDILKKSERDNSIRVTEIDIRHATTVGENFATIVHRIQAEINRDNKTEKVSLIAKTMHIIDSRVIQMMEEMGIFQKETSMLKNTLKKMNELLGPDERLSPRFIFSSLKNPIILVMEDLAPLGFRMAARQAGLDLAHSLLAIRNLAKFHASSVAVCEQEPGHNKLYVQDLSDKKHAQIGEMLSGGVALLGKTIADWPELDEKYSKKIMQLAPCIAQKLIEASMAEENKFHVITHGDFWINNMLFRYDQFGEPTEHIFIDFQMSMWNSPAADLQYFMNSSLSNEVDLNHRNRLLKEYRRSLLITMKRLGCKTPTPTLQELESAMRHFEINGMIATFLVLPLIMWEKTEAIDIKHVFEKQNNPALENNLYREVLIRRLPEFEKNGLLDV